MINIIFVSQSLNKGRDKGNHRNNKHIGERRKNIGKATPTKPKAFNQ